MVLDSKFSWEKPKTNQKGLYCTVGDIPCIERTLVWRLCFPSWVSCNRVESCRLIDCVGSCQGVLFPLLPVAMWFELKAEIHLNRVIECKAETWTSSNSPVNPEEKRLGCWVSLLCSFSLSWGTSLEALAVGGWSGSWLHLQEKQLSGADITWDCSENDVHTPTNCSAQLQPLKYICNQLQWGITICIYICKMSHSLHPAIFRSHCFKAT